MIPKLIVYHHLGLGDHFICNGLVHNVSKNYGKIYLPCKVHNYETVKCLYSESPKIEVFKIDRDEHQEVLTLSKILNIPVLKVGFEHCNYFNNWDRSFYKQLNIDFLERYSRFYLPKSVEGSKEIYDSVIGNKDEYILVHDNSSEKNEYDIDISLGRDEKEMPPIVKITNKVTNNLLQWIDIVQNASEIHVVPSSVFCLIDSIDLNPKCKLHYHGIRTNNMVINSQLNNYKWNIIKY